MAEANTLVLSQSAFYKITTRARLAEILLLSPRQLKYLARGTKYDHIQVLNKNGSPRPLQVPWGKLRDAHDRVAYLFSQLQARSYLHSGVRGRSPVTNAQSHMSGTAGMRVDVRKFFPSCSRISLARFFRYDMGMAGDVAHLLSRLCTCNDALPTGSPLSMPLAFWMHVRLFDRINEEAMQAGYSFTLFVDDMNFSAEVGVPAKFKLAVRSELRRVGLREHPRKTSRAPVGMVRKITGVILPGAGRMRVSNAQRARFLDGLESMKRNPDTAAAVLPSLRGLLAWMRQVEPNIFPRAGAELLRFGANSM